MTTKVSERIEDAPMCEVINLTEAEAPLYTGAGWKIARFEDGELKGFFDPRTLPHIADAADAANEALHAATAWLAQAKGETWLVMCSSYQLCEPTPVSLNAPSSIARMARIFGEIFQ